MFLFCGTSDLSNGGHVYLYRGPAVTPDCTLPQIPTGHAVSIIPAMLKNVRKDNGFTLVSISASQPVVRRPLVVHGGISVVPE